MIGHNPAGMYRPRSPVSHGVAPGEGRQVYVTGQCAFDENREVVGAGDVEVQMRLCLAHIERIVASFGGEIGDIAMLTIFYTRASDQDRIRELWADTFDSVETHPACVLIEVAGLTHPDLLIELVPSVVIPNDRFRLPIEQGA